MPGAGIGVALSSVIQLAGVMKTYLIWVAKEPEATCGAEVLQLVHAIAPERRLIIDTACQQRPDIPALVAERAGLEQADTVYIVSNPQLPTRSGTRATRRASPPSGPSGTPEILTCRPGSLPTRWRLCHAFDGLWRAGGDSEILCRQALASCPQADLLNKAVTCCWS